MEWEDLRRFGHNIEIRRKTSSESFRKYVVAYASSSASLH